MEPQLSLQLEVDALNDNALRAAWARSGLRIPYQVALTNRALAICLRDLADAMRRKATRRRKHRYARSGCRSN